MPVHGGIVHSKLPSDAEVHVRDRGTPIAAADVEQFSAEFVATGLIAIKDALRQLATNIENRAYPVDEYVSAPITGAATSNTLTVLPQYEYMWEKIISVVIVGPPAAAVTLTLGDRVWPLVIPATGILDVGPMGALLNRNDLRQLYSSTAGQYSLELMGWANRRFAV